ncbi:expressed protein [Echinococcus multilocularis]|uniref:Expressed protein n=1 Tax=Echinococcus multilocularis TaxID=6211 RepID=A0A068Y7I9_ECHMU|nr:expressed protein [Echinococcus multilocularis]
MTPYSHSYIMKIESKYSSLRGGRNGYGLQKKGRGSKETNVRKIRVLHKVVAKFCQNHETYWPIAIRQQAVEIHM